jgi:hypothetical protein
VLKNDRFFFDFRLRVTAARAHAGSKVAATVANTPNLMNPRRFI